MKNAIMAMMLLLSINSYAQENQEMQKEMIICQTGGGHRKVTFTKVAHRRFKTKIEILDNGAFGRKMLAPLVRDFGVMHISEYAPDYGSSSSPFYYMAPVLRNGQEVGWADSDAQLVVGSEDRKALIGMTIMDTETRFAKEYRKRGGDSNGSMYCDVSLNKLLK